jgi:hypothetical protein
MDYASGHQYGLAGWLEVLFSLKIITFEESTTPCVVIFLG